METLGIDVIVLHHAGKADENFKGPVDLVSLCQNVIHLEGRNQLVGDDGLLSELTGALGEDGPVVRMTIEKCKNYLETSVEKWCTNCLLAEPGHLLKGNKNLKLIDLEEM